MSRASLLVGRKKNEVEECWFLIRLFRSSREYPDEITHPSSGAKTHFFIYIYVLRWFCGLETISCPGGAAGSKGGCRKHTPDLLPGPLFDEVDHFPPNQKFL